MGSGIKEARAAEKINDTNLFQCSVPFLEFSSRRVLYLHRLIELDIWSSRRSLNTQEVVITNCDQPSGSITVP